MGIWDKIYNFAAKCESVSSNLNEKLVDASNRAKKYAEEERVKYFYEMKAKLVDINKKQRDVGIKETTIFEFFKDQPSYADLLEKERDDSV